MMLQEGNKVQQVGIIEGAMLKAQQLFQMLLFMMADEFIRRIVHALHQLPAFLNDGGAVAPCKYGRKKSRDLDVLLLCITMRNAHRIILNERRLIVFINLP